MRGAVVPEDDQSIGLAAVHGKAAVFHIYSIDVAYLIDLDDGEEGISRTIAARADGSMARHITDFGARTGNFQGTSEESEIADRGRRAAIAGGRSIWSPTILRREAPYLMNLPSGPDMPKRSEAIRSQGQVLVDFKCVSMQMRMFRRGVLSIMFRHDFAPPEDRRVRVAHFVDALRAIGDDLAARARTEVDKFLDAARNGRHHFGGGKTAWRKAGAETTAVIRDSLVEHAVYFMEATPGFEPVHDDGILDPNDLRLHKSIAYALDTNQLKDRYDYSYTNELITRASRWREDELYVTEHRRSLIILADYWIAGDSLVHYMEDLVLAAAFELAKITHVRFLARYLEHAAPRFDVGTKKPSKHRDAIRFVEIMQEAVYHSSYDDPTENLISHKFTARFLAGISRERNTAHSIQNTANRTETIAQRIQLQTTMAIAERTLKSQRSTQLLTVVAVIAAVAGVAATIIGLT
jgi:hypothetical protein